MSVVEALSLEFRAVEKRNIEFAEINCTYDLSKERNGKGETFEKKVKNEGIHGTLLNLAKSKLKTNVAPKVLTFGNLDINMEFLNALKEYVVIKRRSIEKLIIASCKIYLSQNEFEDFLCPLKPMEIGFCYNTFHNGAEFNDKICSGRTGLLIWSWTSGLVYSQITDSLIEKWKANPPPFVSITMKTAFTIKAITELILYVCENGISVEWNLGSIECGPEDAKYLLELQKIRNTEISFNRQFTLTQGKRSYLANSPSKFISVGFWCKFV